MLYLEDYLEMIEHLPQELRDRFTDMREMDLQVQNTMDTLEKRVKIFFSNAKKMKSQEKELEYETIRKDYYKTLEDADEKVQLANHMHDLVSRYLRRLEQETHKFKMELEADNMGITEILEKRSQELDLPPSNGCQKENRYSFTSHRGSVTNSIAEKRRDSVTSEHKQRVVSTVSEPRVMAQNPSPSATPLPVVNYSLSHMASGGLGHMGAGGTAIAAAASQAIAATQQMQQGRRTASLKASYEAINSTSSTVGAGTSGSHSHELSISKELAGAAQTAIAAIQDTSKKNKKQKVNMGNSSPAIPALILSPNVSPQPDRTADLSYDPNEPRYCICNEVAFGGMVACDNQTCPYEWFHYPCVGITDPPKGKWYCPQCTAAMKRRGSRKN